MDDLGDVLVRIHYKGDASNRVRVGIGHVGGGPSDDPGAVPTPGPGPTLSINPITAGTLTTGEVQTIIAQAVSAAVSLNKLVTVAVTDREGNVLGVFSMTGAPTMMQIRGGGPLQTPDPITGLVPVGLEGTRLPSRFAAISKAGPQLFLHLRKRLHYPHRRLHHSGTLSARRYFSRGWAALRRAIFFAALL